MLVKTDALQSGSFPSCPLFFFFPCPKDKPLACWYICRYLGLFTSSLWSSPLSHVHARVCVHIPACKLVPVSYPSLCIYQLLFHNHLPEVLMAPYRALRNYDRSFVKQLEARGIFAFQSYKCHGRFFLSAGLIKKYRGFSHKDFSVPFVRKLEVRDFESG